MKPSEPLASRLSEHLERAGLSVERVSERTKVPRTTVRALVGAGGLAVLPPRVYMRAHLGVIAREIGMEEQEAYALFDETFPESPGDLETSRLPRISAPTMAVAAGLGGVGILAVILSFVS